MEDILKHTKKKKTALEVELGVLHLCTHDKQKTTDSTTRQ